jgi:hypothetical protein
MNSDQNNIQNVYNPNSHYYFEQNNFQPQNFDQNDQNNANFSPHHIVQNGQKLGQFQQNLTLNDRHRQQHHINTIQHGYGGYNENNSENFRDDEIKRQRRK